MKDALRERSDRFRMYGMTAYQLTGIQKGIQHGHAINEYARQWSRDYAYKSWSRIHKTVIILNGGTTNKNPERLGTLNAHTQTLRELGVKVAEFYDPDLGDQLLANAFILPCEVYDEKSFPNMREYLMMKFPHKRIEWMRSISPEEEYSHHYKEWLKTLENPWFEPETIFRIRKFINSFQLATD